MDHSDAIGNELTFVQTDNRMLATVLISGCTQNPFGCAPYVAGFPTATPYTSREFRVATKPGIFELDHNFAG